jgi:hypothetical protein
MAIPTQPFVRSQAFGDPMQPARPMAPQSSQPPAAAPATDDSAFEDEFEIPAFLRQK